ncbi:carbohydrate ABC transporter permease [Oscillospiraceae bacterium HV4-5-C5C]|nr:carbohydrate ABC transporter permease [Oscillospiraceae bacterium]MDD4369219.1 carbohydrate ABC transporter permease [Oscillospiraceae bacterium]NJP41761.1 carbohydrate ABC transporter permease [Oscillospiraceae bacterium HV4-5-C5C]
MREKKHQPLLTLAFTLLSLVWVFPIFAVVMNSFKKKVYINRYPFTWPTGKSFVGWDNYVEGLRKTHFFNAFGYSVFITVVSVAVILICTSMTAWYITRVKGAVSKIVYTLCLFAMVVPFQMVMYPLSKLADFLKLSNPLGIVVVYLGFGAGLAIFMFCGFVRNVPMEVEEAAMIDGCNPLQTFFKVVIPILKPSMVTVAILDIMWIWNDYLLPVLVLDQKKYQTVPIVIQYLKGGYGSIDWGAMMAMLTLTIIPVVAFYLAGQKYIIRGVAAGAVKG